MAFALLIIYISVLLVRPQEWYPALSGYQLVNVVAIPTIFTTFISQSSRRNPVATLFRNKIALFMFALFSAVVLSQLSRLRLMGAVDAFTSFGKMVVLFSLTMILVDTPSRVRKIMWVIILCAALLAVSAILQVRQGYGFGGVTPFGSFETGDFRVRGTGLFGDPNDFAMLYLMATPFVFSLLQVRGGLLSKCVLLLALPAFLFTLYYTQSRGAVVGFCALLIAYLWGANRVSPVRLWLTALVLATAIVLGPARARESVYEDSAAGRIEQWGVGNMYLKQNPLFGIGYQRWGDLESTAPHSSFVQCYAELGLVGYFFWLGLCWLVLRSLLRTMRLKSELGLETTLLARGLFASLVGYLVSAFFLTHAYHPPLYFLLGMGVGLVRFAERQPNVPHDALTITAKDLRWSLAIEALTIPTVWLIARFYWMHSG